MGRKPEVKDKKSEKVKAKKKTSKADDDDDDDEPKKKTTKKKGNAKLTGRPKGVRYVIPKKYMKKLMELKSEMDDQMEEFNARFDSFTEKGNKSAARDARKFIMEIGRSGKELRKLIQTAKDNLEQEEVE